MKTFYDWIKHFYRNQNYYETPEGELVITGNMEIPYQEYDGGELIPRWFIDEYWDRENKRIPAEQVEKYKKLGFNWEEGAYFSDQFENTWYQVRGRKITEEQAFEIISRETPLFRHWDKTKNEKPFDRLYEPRSAALNDIIGKDFGKRAASGWLRPDGTIYENDYYRWGVYDDFETFKWIDLALKYPYLDMVISYSGYEGHPCEDCPLREYYRKLNEIKNLRKFDGVWWKKVKDCEEKMRKDRCYACNGKAKRQCVAELGRIYAESSWKGSVEKEAENYIAGRVLPEFDRDVLRTIWIHDGSIEILTGEYAGEVYKMYEERYGEEKPKKDSESKEDEPILSDAYIVKCFESMKINGESALRLAQDKGYAAKTIKIEDTFTLVEGRTWMSFSRKELDFDIYVSDGEECQIYASQEQLREIGWKKVYGPEIGEPDWEVWRDDDSCISPWLRSANCYRGTLEFGNFCFEDLVILAEDTAGERARVCIPRTLFTGMNLDLKKGQVTLIYDGDTSQFVRGIKAVNGKTFQAQLERICTI